VRRGHTEAQTRSAHTLRVWREAEGVARELQQN